MSYNLFILVLGLAGLVVPEASRADQITLQCKLLSGANATYGQVELALPLAEARHG